MKHLSQDLTRKFGAAAAVASVVVAAVYVVGCTKHEIPESEGAQIVLEASQSAGTSPWMDSIATGAAPSVVPASADLFTAVPGDVQTVSGAEVGLYGGTPNSPVCDRQKMDTFLGRHEDKADAFREVSGAGDIGDYLGGLSPVVLTADTRVTNHGFDDGVTTFQSVLEKGTTVLVDDVGVPRVRCACGNPLSPPVAPAAASNVTYANDPWPDMQVEKFVAVTPAPKPVERLVLTNVVSGDALPPNAPPPPPLAIEPGSVVPVVATPEVLQDAQRVAEEATGTSTNSSVVTNNDNGTGTGTSDVSGTPSSDTVTPPSDTPTSPADTGPSTGVTGLVPQTDGTGTAVDPANGTATPSEPPSVDPTESSPVTEPTLGSPPIDESVPTVAVDSVTETEPLAPVEDPALDTGVVAPTTTAPAY